MSNSRRTFLQSGAALAAGLTGAASRSDAQAPAPQSNMPPGAPGDEDNDDMRGLEPGQKEGAGKTGEEIKLSPEEAAQLLNGFKLGGERRLPLGEEGKSKPKNPIGRTW